jgi:hypothetical protein
MCSLLRDKKEYGDISPYLQQNEILKIKFNYEGLAIVAVPLLIYIQRSVLLQPCFQGIVYPCVY